MYGITPYMSMIIIGIVLTTVRRMIMTPIMIGMPVLLPDSCRSGR
jgi:hypothetical protein